MGKVTFDYAKLRGRIKEKCVYQKEYAKLLGISEASLTSKLRGKTYFSQKEIEMSRHILDIEPGEVSKYFFTEKV